MSSTGVEFGILALRVTENRNGALGASLLRDYRMSVELAPVIETGRILHSHYPKGRYKEPDRFRNWEFMLFDRRRLWKRDKRLWRILRAGAAVEFWTKAQPGEPKEWIHWMFPYTKWRKLGTGIYVGQSHGGPEFSSDEVPDGSPITDGAFWRTTDPPPKPALI